MIDKAFEAIGFLIGTAIFAICLYLDTTREERKRERKKKQESHNVP